MNRKTRRKAYGPNGHKPKRAPSSGKPGATAQKRSKWLKSAAQYFGKKTLVAVGAGTGIVAAGIIGLLLNNDILPWLQTSTGQPPAFAHAAEKWTVDDPVQRTVPPGQSTQIEHLLASGNPESAQGVGIATGILQAQLLVQAKNTTVTITDISLIAHHERIASGGTLIYAGSQGANPAIQLSLNADFPATPIEDLDGSAYFNHFSVELSPGESTEFGIRVSAQEYYSQFTFDITAYANGKVSNIIVDDNGKPFQIVPPSNAYSAVYTQPLDNQEHRWVKVNITSFCQKNRQVCWPSR
jgi:hypothetical protein